MTNTNKPNALFWVVGVIALLWNGMGVNYYLQSAFKTEASTAGLNEAQIELMEAMPAWYTALFAIAVFTGLLGAVLFLMKKKVAAPLFIISFVTATINQIYWLFMTDAPEVFADQAPYVMPALVVVIAIFLVWYSKDQKKRGILR